MSTFCASLVARICSVAEDAVAIHADVKSKQSVAMHWGTFSLTDEPLLEPPVRVSKVSGKAVSSKCGLKLLSSNLTADH